MKKLYYYDDNLHKLMVVGPHSGIINTDNIYGDCTHIRGNAQHLTGYISGISGDVSGIVDDVTGLFGDVTGLIGCLGFGNTITDVEVL
jgi:hypothetical protein|tara:strand:- start:927 stop:1190 length:264 start_codon:yes stop_codon:yes gene_type:complete